jgi:1-acyl-sn-glycerol-3-phosphate acyltransferase
MRAIRATVRLSAFAGLTLALMPVQQVLLWIAPPLAKRLPHRYHRLVCRILGVKLRIVGTLPRRGPALIVSNHVSWLDIPVLSAVAPVSFVAKREVGTWPFFGTLARLQRTVFVDRDRRHRTGASAGELAARLAEGDMVVLFPEGTSSDGSGVLPFKSAFFAGAEAAGTPVIPVAVAYAGFRNLPMGRRLRPSYAWYGGMDLPPHLWQALATGPIEVTLVCHAPLAAENGVTRKDLARTAETAIRRSLARALHGRLEMS